MKLDDFTKSELVDKFDRMSTSSIVEFLRDRGLQLKPDFPKLEPGLYRRRDGLDLIFVNSKGVAWPVSLSETGDNTYKTVHWTIGSRTDQWVRVLDTDHRPIMNGMIATFDTNGNRIA